MGAVTERAPGAVTTQARQNNIYIYIYAILFFVFRPGALTARVR